MKIMSADAFTTLKSSPLFIIQMIIRGFRLPFITSYSLLLMWCKGTGMRDEDHYRNWIPLSPDIIIIILYDSCPPSPT